MIARYAGKVIEQSGLLAGGRSFQTGAGGASLIDTRFNVNVITSSNGVIMGGSGGYNDIAVGARRASRAVFWGCI